MTPRDEAKIGLSAIFHGQIQRGGGDSHVVIGFFSSTGTDPLENQLYPLGPIATRGRFIRTSVNMFIHA